MLFILTPTTKQPHWGPFIKTHLHHCYMCFKVALPNVKTLLPLQHIFMAIASLVTAAAAVVVVSLMAVATTTAGVELSTPHILKGKVVCLDCDAAYDLSGIVVMAKCEKAGKAVTATTAKDGSFEAELPSDECEARLGGGRNQLYAARKDTVAEIVRAVGGPDNVYGMATPLAFCSSCRCKSIASKAEKYCKAGGGKFGSSKTFDLPLPPEWGLAPSSYYFPFFPIIGIP